MFGILETSQDLFYIVLSIAIISFTVFLCWFMYYLIRILKNAVYMVEKVTTVMQKADKVLDLIQEKLESGGTYFALAANAVKSIVEYAVEKKTTAKKTVSRKKK